jgi:hypothetical protein
LCLATYNKTNLWNIGLTLVAVAPGVVGWVWDGVDGNANKYPDVIDVKMASLN